MIPTIGGRLQTRVFSVLVIGGLWTLIITPLLPGLDGPLGTQYAITFINLVYVFVLGLLWEFVYHFFQYKRWEKDWPIVFAFLVGINEGLLAWLLVGPLMLNPAAPDGVGGLAFTVHFVTTWIVTWLYIVGPIRAVFPRWRFNGGKFVG